MIALFDFDGVIMDTEGNYTWFWGGIGEEFFGDRDFGRLIKGQTLNLIFDKYFSGDKSVYRDEVQRRLIDFEANMPYEYVPGVQDFLLSLRKEGIKTAIVTSSNMDKMNSVYRSHPEIRDMVDAILTSEDFKASKPDPDCFLKGMERLGGTPQDTVVFEDSFNGLAAARASGAKVIGLATTNPAEAIATFCDLVIPDFVGFRI